MPPANERAGERAGEAVAAPQVVVDGAAGETAGAKERKSALWRRIGAGLVLSVLLHGAAAWLVFFGPGAVRALPPTVDEPIEVVLIEPPAAEEQAEEQAEPPPPPPPEPQEEEETPDEEAQAAPPPPPPAPEPEPEPKQEETPETPEAPTETAAVPRVLMPVTEFAEEDSGSEDRAGEIALRESLDEPTEAAPQETAEPSPEAEAQDQPAGEGEIGPQGPGEAESEGTAETGETGAAEELAAETPGALEEGAPQEGEAAPESEPEAETEMAALTEPSETETEGVGDLDVLAAPTQGTGLPAGGTAVPRAKPADIPLFAGSRADPQSEAEAVARAIAATTPGSGGLSFARPGGGGADGEGELAGGTTATRLFSRDISDDPRMRTAMNGMPQAARVDLLCMTELRAQLRTATPPYQPDLLPSFRLESGTVLQPRRAAFRAGGQWYDLAFRCELNTQVTRVESFTFRVGAPVPRAEWSARRFPGN